MVFLFSPSPSLGAYDRGLVPRRALTAYRIRAYRESTRRQVYVEKNDPLLPSSGTVCSRRGVRPGDGGAVTGTVVTRTAAPSRRDRPPANKATGSRSPRSHRGGRLQFPDVPVGDHNVAVEVGIRAADAGAKVALNQTTSVDITLRAAGSRRSRGAAASEALVQSDSSQLGKTYETQLVQKLPTFGNQTRSLCFAERRRARLRHEARRLGRRHARRSNVFTLDGVTTRPRRDRPSVGVIQTRSISSRCCRTTSTPNSAAAAGQFVTITRSGTNELRVGVRYAQINLKRPSTAEEVQLQSGEINENRASATRASASRSAAPSAK